MQVLHSEIPIRADPETIWKTLVVFPSIPSEIRDAICNRKIGQNLRVFMNAGGWGATLTVQLLAVEPFREIRWKGYLWIPGLFDGEHCFEIRQDTGGVSRLVQREIFNGLLLPLLSGTLRDTKQEFERMNVAIRDRAEQGIA